MASTLYILISIIVLLIIAILVFVIKGNKKKKFNYLFGLAFAFILAGIIFGDNRLIGYVLIGIGILIAIIDIIKNGASDNQRKLGIFRSGSKKAVYRAGKERPIEFQDSGVFNSKKDLINFNNKKKKV
ncbi:hypothetical protein J4218_03110 [Candidatus Pacearchaeota archaeon]|nr:hypothetical protein [Candidatus Pacearchaeota archaeon]